MLFNSLSFLLFFPFVCTVYYLLPRATWRTWFLLFASFYFYLSLDPICGIILFASIVITYYGALALQSKYCDDLVKKRRVVYGIISLNILILGFFKYTNFISESFVGLLNLAGGGISAHNFSILLPVGISFYIFKTISYISDVYKGRIKAERDFHIFALYIAFFPQLLAGPIERAGNLIPQFKKKIGFDGRNVTAGLKMMLWGYFMKLVFADRATIYVDTVYGNIHAQNGTAILVAAILYSFQIYCDFAGYSLLSIGVAKAMGYDVMQNFNRPYMATSITDFWKRWHISLTRWLTDYVYIPLGGSRCSKVKTYRNIMVTFLVSGLWHGAAWNFVIWGAMHGCIQVAEKHLGLAKNKVESLLTKISRTVITFFIATLAWMFFRLSDFSDAIYGICRIFTSVGSPIGGRDVTPAFEYCVLGLFFVLGKDILDEYYSDRFKLFDNDNIVIRFVSYLAISMLILAAGVFDDSQFIYMQF